MPSASIRLFLARHGETPGNREMRYLGSVDEALSSGGVEQAERLAAALGPLPLAAVYASPLRRAAETGRRIAAARGLDLRLEARLREQCFGAWEGLTRSDVLEQGGREALLRWESDLALAPPGGESLTAVQTRMIALVENLRQEHAGVWVVLVSHVGPIKALLCAALDAPLATARHLL